MSVVIWVVGAVALGVVGLGGLVVLTVLLAGWLAIRIPAEYFSAMSRMIDSELSSYAMAEESYIGRHARLSRHTDQPRAFPQYFFGQVQIDTQRIIRDFGSGVRTVLADRWAAAADILESSNSYAENILAVTIRIGIVIGAVCGLVISAVIGLIHLVMAIFCAITAALMAVILRAADAVIRLVAGVRMVCPVCVHVARPYAIYEGYSGHPIEVKANYR
jgi:hypothetical protein